MPCAWEKHTRDTPPQKKTKALIAILAIWCQARSSSTRDLPMAVLQGLINNVAVPFETTLCLQNGDRVSVRLARGLIHVDKPITGALTSSEAPPAAHLIVKLFYEHRDDDLCRTIIAVVAAAIEEGARLFEKADDPLDRFPELCRRRKRGAPVDIELLERLCRVQGEEGQRSRSAFQLSRSAKSLHLDAPTHSTAIDGKRGRLYLLAARKAFDGFRTVSLTVDAKRFGGKHWLASAFYGGDADRTCWCPPVVPLRNIATPTPRTRPTPRPIVDHGARARRGSGKFFFGGNFRTHLRGSKNPWFAF